MSFLYPKQLICNLVCGLVHAVNSSSRDDFVLLAASAYGRLGAFSIFLLIFRSHAFF